MKKGWRVVRWGTAAEEQLVEVIPIGDTRRHLRGKQSPQCWCQPRMETTDAGKPLVGHNAADARQLVEEHGIN